MFHNSTTIYRFSQQSIRFAKEGRMIYGTITNTLSSLKSGTLGAWKTTKKVLWGTSNVMLLGAPYLIRKSKKAIKEKALWGLAKGEEGVRTGWEGAMGVKDMTVGPVATWGVEAPLTDLKMSLVDVPISAVSATVGTPIDAVKQLDPRKIIENTRDTFRGIFGGIGGAVKNIFQPREFFTNIGKAFKNTLLPPWLTRPIVDVTKRTRKLVSNIVGSKTQYLEKIFVTAPRRVKAGWERLKNARATGVQKTREAIAGRLGRQEQWEKEQEEELEKRLKRDEMKKKADKIGRE